MKVISFRPDKSAHLNKAKVIQNSMIAVNDEQAHFLDYELVSYLKSPIVFGLLGERKETVVTTNSDESNTLDPFGPAEYIDGAKALYLKNTIEDKIQIKVATEAERNPAAKDQYERWLGILMIIGGVGVVVLGIVVAIPYVVQRFGGSI